MMKPDTTDYGFQRGNLVSDLDQTYIVENILVRGISVRRAENESNYDYRLRREKEDHGLKLYKHKYFEGYSHYYEFVAQEKLHNELKAINAKLKGKAIKWHPESTYGHDYNKGEVEGWDDNEIPTQDYIDAVEIER